LFIKVLLTTLSILAVISQGTAADNPLEFSVLDKNFYYAEYDDDGALRSKEFGHIPGLGLSLVNRTGQSEISLELKAYYAIINYDGHTQAGAPHTTKTDTQMYEFGVLHRSKLVGKNHEFVFGYKREYWVRDILPKDGVLGLFELYHWNSFQLGYEYKKAYGLHMLTLGADWLWHTNNKMKLDFSGIEPTNIPLKDAFGWQTNISYSYKTSDKWVVLINLQQQKWSSDRSNSVLVDSQYGALLIHEPRSETKNRIFGLSISKDY